MRQVVVELLDCDADAVSAMANARHQSAEQVVQQALEAGLRALRDEDSSNVVQPAMPMTIEALQAGFGIWKDCPDVPKDGLEYQLMVRAEWD